MIDESGESILNLVNVSKTFSLGRRRTIQALDNVSISLRPGETLGIVGESGCGKSTLLRTVVRLVEPDGGRVEFGGMDVAKVGARRLRQVRRRIQIVFQ